LSAEDVIKEQAPFTKERHDGKSIRIDPVVADTGIGLEAHDETAGDAGSDHEEEND
jgi:hypothetical protein